MQLLSYVASALIVGAIVYAFVNIALASSTGLKGGVPVGDLEASFVAAVVGIFLHTALAVRRRMAVDTTS
jgi:hypothetical protein